MHTFFTFIFTYYSCIEYAQFLRQKKVCKSFVVLAGEIQNILHIRSIIVKNFNFLKIGKYSYIKYNTIFIVLHSFMKL